ncbi:Gfo/Idh/MocA family protein [Segnochrobactrum spirostomi]|uniref:Gfo/Idh/MocA family oxidoreductase n=1 Tax=Segnochrobactrum spirostomi TaxID=2608987 RepID=A0A6A7Y0H2_9HYPH|nr:Gfo/Idh/MocA family oxidoreductase [Segnochrobactrum spirostomi]MQT12106.1 Gfo/Idh/MocA family oxidoreductase [Segnochrobactrum spirostomi]
MSPCRIGIVGLGKIAEDQHVPVILKNPAFALAAVASQRGHGVTGVPTFRSHGEMFAAVPEMKAVAICTPPKVRHAIAREALAAGLDVMLEKPPAATLSELADLAAFAAERGRVLFTTWHSQYNPAVEWAADVLKGRTVRTLEVTWKEDVRRWHPGQDWIWRAGGFGVFDPGINALSIVTRILPAPVFVETATLVTPANADAPIAADLVFASAAPGAARLNAAFDWRQTGDQTWTIRIETAEGQELLLENGGARLLIDGMVTVDEPMAEYERIYEHFAALVEGRRSHVDDAPLRLVADSFLIGRRIETDAFHW